MVTNVEGVPGEVGQSSDSDSSSYECDLGDNGSEDSDDVSECHDENDSCDWIDVGLRSLRGILSVQKGLLAKPPCTEELAACFGTGMALKADSPPCTRKVPVRLASLPVNVSAHKCVKGASRGSIVPAKPCQMNAEDLVPLQAQCLKPMLARPVKQYAALNNETTARKQILQPLQKRQSDSFRLNSRTPVDHRWERRMLCTP